MSRKHIWGRGLVFAAGSMFGSFSWAGVAIGGVVEYEPLAVATATAVPTLGEWSLLLMSLLLGVIAFRALRSKVSGRLLSNLVLTGGAVAAIGSGSLIGKVYASLEVEELLMDKRTGGSLEIKKFVSTTLNNTSGVALKIKSITSSEGSKIEPLPDSARPECKVGLVVTPGQKCDILIIIPI